MATPATMKVWVAFGTELFDDTALASDGNWTDVTDDIRGTSTFSTSKRRGQFDTFTAGQGMFSLTNRDGTYDPGYASGTYFGQFKRHTPVRVTAEHSSTRYTIWFGAVRQWIPDYIGTFDGWTTLRCEDMLGVMSHYELPSMDAVYAGDTTADRLGRVLDEMGFPSGWRSLGNGGNAVTHVATDWGTNALQHTVDIATADGGMVYADRDGTITQDSRNSGGIVSRQTTSQVTLAASGTEPTYQTIKHSGVGDEYRDIVRVSAAVGDPQEVDNSAADSAPVVFQKLRTTLENESQAAAVANFYADLYSQDVVTPVEITTRIATNSTDIRTVLLPRQVRDRITVTYDPPGAPTLVTTECFIDGISHEVTLDDWQVQYRLSSADQYDGLDGPPTSWMVVGHASRGKVGTGKVGY